MKTLKKVQIVPVEVEYIPELPDMEENTFYVSAKYKTVAHRCLCGCGCQVITPTSSNMWTATLENDKLSLTPSIGSYNLPCKSHYILTKNIANFV